MKRPTPVLAQDLSLCQAEIISYGNRDCLAELYSLLTDARIAAAQHRLEVAETGLRNIIKETIDPALAWDTHAELATCMSQKTDHDWPKANFVKVWQCPIRQGRQFLRTNTGFLFSPAQAMSIPNISIC
jgi:hypothetical protein